MAGDDFFECKLKLRDMVGEYGYDTVNEAFDAVRSDLADEEFTQRRE